MSLDEQLRAVLSREAEMQTPTRPDIDSMIVGGRARGRARRRSRRTRLIGIVAAAAVLVGGVYEADHIDPGDADSQPGITGRPPHTAAADDLRAALAADPYHSAASDFNDGAAPTFEDLAGLWMLRVPYDAVPLMVDGDGDWDHGILLDSDALGSSTLNGRVWTRHFEPACGGVRKLPWAASIAGDGSLHLAFRGTLNICTPADDREVWDRLAPGSSPVMDFLRETADQIDWQARATWDRPGLYVDPATGELLDIADDGGYRHLDTVGGNDLVPGVQGVLDPADATQPGTVSGSCGDGTFTATYEVGRTPAVGGYILPHSAVRITPAGKACSKDIGAARTWVKVAAW